MANSRGFGLAEVAKGSLSIDEARRHFEEQGYEVIAVSLDPEGERYIAQVRDLDGV